MADISKIQIESGTYDIKDEVARTLIDNINKDRIVCVGDSYLQGIGNNNIGWGYYLQQILGLTNSDFFSYSEGGSGVVKKGVNNHNFLELLQLNIGNVTSKETITKVIIAGGWNDYEQGDQNLNDGVEALIVYCKTQFPKAKIYFGMLGYSTDLTNDGYARRLYYKAKLVRLYSNCNSWGGIYLTGIENVLHYNLFMGVDTIHPNNLGYVYLARCMYQALKNGSVKFVGVTEESSTISDSSSSIIDNPSDLNIKAILTDDNVMLSLDPPVTLNFKSGTASVSTGANVYLGKITNPNFIPSKKIQIPCFGYIQYNGANFVGSNFVINMDNAGNVAINIQILKNDGSAFFNLANPVSIVFQRTTPIYINNAYC